MDMEQYQEYAGETDEYADRVNNEDVALLCLSCGLASEAGEVAGKVRKLFRDGHVTDGLPSIDADVVASIAKELGDTLWYVARTAAALGYSLDEIAVDNLDKLRDRARRNAITGEGDDR